jgi:TatD DNase family protein
MRSPLTPAETLQEARLAGVETVINVGDDATDNRPGIELTEQFPGLRTTVGRHPHAAGEPITAAVRQELRSLAAHQNVVAIGEIGLDYHYTDYHRVAAKEQADTLREMLALAAEMDKPVVLHTREAFEDTFTILDEFAGMRGVFHCFSGNAAFASEGIARGFYLSFAATVTYPGAHGVIGAASIIPLERMLVETDAPFLPPQSRRGKPNAPRYLPETVDRIATLRGVAAGVVAAATRQNAIDLFGLPYAS